MCLSLTWILDLSFLDESLTWILDSSLRLVFDMDPGLVFFRRLVFDMDGQVCAHVFPRCFFLRAHNKQPNQRNPTNTTNMASFMSRQREFGKMEEKKNSIEEKTMTKIDSVFIKKLELS